MVCATYHTAWRFKYIFWDLKMNAGMWITYSKTKKHSLKHKYLPWYTLPLCVYLNNLYFHLLLLTLVNFCCALSNSLCHLNQTGCFTNFYHLLSTEYDFHLNVCSYTHIQLFPVPYTQRHKMHNTILNKDQNQAYTNNAHTNTLFLKKYSMFLP